MSLNMYNNAGHKNKDSNDAVFYFVIFNLILKNCESFNEIKRGILIYNLKKTFT